MIRRLISNFALAFLKRTLALLLVLGSGQAFAWTIEGFSLPAAELQELQARFPQLNEPYKLQQLLEYLAHQRSFAELRIIQRNGTWVVQGELAAEITAIAVNTVTFYLRSELETITGKYIGRVDSIDNRLKLQQELQQLLRDKGFPQATITLRALREQDGASYQLQVDKNYPCVIKEIALPFRVPDDFDLSIETGDLCDVGAIRNAVEELRKALRDAGYREVRLRFDKINYATSQRQGTVVLSGKLGRKITYVFVDEEGDELSDFFLEGVNIEASVGGQEALAAALRRRLRSRGYVQATVAQPTIKTTANSVTYRYVVAVGSKFNLKAVHFEGVNFIPAARAVEIAAIEEFAQEDIQAGLVRLSAFYSEQGFPQLQISEARPDYDMREKAVSLVIKVNEGQQRHFSYLSVQGNLFLSTEKIREMLAIDEGEVLDQRKVQEFEQNLAAEYQRHGFIYVQLKLNIDVPDANSTATRLLLEVKENKRAKFGALRIIGLKRTLREVVSRELSFQYGDWYDQAKLTATERALSKLGIFSLVQVYADSSPAATQQQEYVGVVIEIREGKPGQVTFGPGYSFRRGLRYSAGMAWNNILGTGRKVRLRAAFSEESHQKPVAAESLLGTKMSAIYFEPYFLNFPLLGILSLVRSAEADEYQRFKSSAEGTLIYELFPDSKLSVYYGQKANRTQGTQEQKTNLITSRQVRIGEAGVRFSLDRRDRISWPAKGLTLDLDLSWARYFLASDLEYFKFNMVNNYFFSLRQDLVFAFSLSYTSYSQVQRKYSEVNILPASERLMIGGSDSVRGFAGANNLGPYVRYYDAESGQYENEVTGGTHKSLLKFELRYQFWRDFLAASIFIDSGNTFFTAAEEQEYRDFLAAQERADARHRSALHDNFNYALSDLLTKPQYLVTKHYISQGVGINYLSPIGLVNVAWGFPLSQPWHDDCQQSAWHCRDRRLDKEHWYQRGRFHFNVGARF